MNDLHTTTSIEPPSPRSAPRKTRVWPIVAVIIVAILGLVALQGYDALKGTGPGTNVNLLSDDTSIPITTEEVKYSGEITGYFAAPQAAGAYPGVVMIHEWWGLNENIKQMARELSGEGYVVLAVDLFGGRVATTSIEARELTGSLNQVLAIENLRNAVKFLRERGAARVASLGWCFGGGQSLQLALSGEQLQGTIIYYGNLVTDESQLSKISWPVLGIFGDQDTSIPVAEVQEFSRTLNALAIPNSVHVYPGVGHAFANPSGAGYAPAETIDAWAKTLEFLEENLRDAA